MNDVPVLQVHEQTILLGKRAGARVLLEGPKRMGVGLQSPGMSGASTSVVNDSSF